MQVLKEFCDMKTNHFIQNYIPPKDNSNEDFWLHLLYLCTGKLFAEFFIPIG